MVLIILTTLIGNLIVIISISHFKQLHTPTNWLIHSMATVDFLLGCLVMPYSMVRSVEHGWYFGEVFCKIHTSTDIMLSSASIFHLSFISIDRYYAVCDPLRYKAKISILVIFAMIFISWSVPALFAFGMIFLELNFKGSCPVMFNKLWGTTLFMAGFFTPGSVMVGIYGKIFAVSRKHAHATNNLPENQNNQMRMKPKSP
ncbi:unnamed protein product [Gulo gulo]|uniref:Trace amine-associated receptor 1 n=1 Tax=Gulo gulo TaxID=48420 RepID=A0A9X9M8Z7_GULGU|nr:unnamed protein product [Gulo gulo]